MHFLSASTDVRLRSQERSEKTIKTVPIRKDNTAPTACPILLARTCSRHFPYPLSHLCCDLAHSAASVARILFLPLCAYGRGSPTRGVGTRATPALGAEDRPIRPRMAHMSLPSTAVINFTSTLQDQAVQDAIRAVQGNSKRLTHASRAHHLSCRGLVRREALACLGRAEEAKSTSRGGTMAPGLGIVRGEQHTNPASRVVYKHTPLWSAFLRPALATTDGRGHGRPTLTRLPPVCRPQRRSSYA